MTQNGFVLIYTYFCFQQPVVLRVQVHRVRCQETVQALPARKEEGREAGRRTEGRKTRQRKEEEKAQRESARERQG